MLIGLGPVRFTFTKVILTTRRWRCGRESRRKLRSEERRPDQERLIEIAGEQSRPNAGWEQPETIRRANLGYMSEMEDYPGPSQSHPEKEGQDPRGRADEEMVKPPAQPEANTKKKRSNRQSSE
jgi:hypothetical protein